MKKEDGVFYWLYSLKKVCMGLFLICFLPLTVSAQNTVMLDANESPPFWSIKLPYDGMCGEIVHAISQEVDIVSYIQFKPLKRLIEDDSNNDLGNPQFYLPNQDFAAIVPIAIYNVSLFYYKPNQTEKISFKRLEDLKGYRIGVLKGTLVDQSILEKKGLSFEESYNQSSLFKKLRLGRIDVVIEVDLIGQSVINQLFSDETELFESTVIPGSAAPIAILIAEDYPDALTLGEQYRQGLQTIINSGKYRSVLEKYYGKEGVPSEWFDSLQRFDRIYNFQGIE